jgi:pyruvate dehydrogenase E2 component (dihydrolipoyllysine-residue acetyltransferase)
LVQVRARLKDELSYTNEPVPSLTDLVVRLVALALHEHPGLNASLVGDTIRQHASVHIGIAVDTERGLLVPVVRDADRKSIHAIAAESARLIDEARRGVSATADLSGGTFTVTNLGMFEIDAFTPIVNLPECAILGMGRVVARPVVLDGEREEIVIRKKMSLSLTFDHRVVDGGPAARFLQRCKQMIERPYVPLTR